MPPRIFAAVILGSALLALPASGQTVEPQSAVRQPASLAEEALRTATAAEQPANLSYANRFIVQFRATVLSRTPAERAAAAALVLDRLVDEVPWGKVTTNAVADARLVSIDGRSIFAIVPEDVNPLTGETIDGTAADTAARLQRAFGEAVELRTPSRLLRSGGVAFGATLVYMAALWLLLRMHRASATRVSQSAKRQLERLPGGSLLVVASRAPDIVRRIVTAVTFLLALFLTDAWLTFVLRRFPYTRPWGEALRSSVVGAIVSFGQRVVDALPGLFVVLTIVVITRLLGRLVSLMFQAIEQERVSLPGVYPETAQPTRRIVLALLWIFALVMSYGYLPGSDSAAFQGVSVFVGLMVSLGSTGIMNQIMSGLTITYSRALRLGDYVKVGDIEGTVVHLGTLATKIKTPRREEITIPNAVVVSNATTNYSRLADTEGVFVPTAVTIGYDTPWRQVHALLLLAAERTERIRADPKPVVLQTALQDFYVQYTLLVCLEHPDLRPRVLDALHANIQDAFNEYGVQIMSPNYEADPNGAKVVPRGRWYAAPATDLAGQDATVADTLPGAGPAAPR